MENLLKTTETLQLKPQMLQSLALLPLSVTDLKEYIEKQVEENPALEYNSFSNHNVEDSKYMEFLESIPQRGETLSEHLLSQLGELNIEDRVASACELLIGNLDLNGFYIVDLKTLFEDTNFSQEEINNALEVVRSFDPFGICVSNFRESLILQAKLMGLEGEELDKFSDVVRNNLEEASNKAELKQFLKTLTPYPGRAFDTSEDSYAVPEFSIHNRDGKLVLKMNKASLPDLAISSDFENLKTSVSGPEAKKTYSYIQEKIQDARNLITQIDMRCNTLNKMAMTLMELQSEFFLNGQMYLKPMKLSDVALQVGVHEATISRLSQNKYVETDFGIFSLKSFFSQGFTAVSGETVSRNVVKTMIQKILEKDSSLSDQKISDLLAAQGIKCARRTVNKYRSEL